MIVIAGLCETPVKGPRPNDAKVQQALSFAKLRAEAEEADNALRARADMVTESDIQRCYNENLPKFEQAELLRIYVPFSEKDRHAAAPPRGPVRLDAANKPSDDPARATAESIRTRAAAGEDFDRLQAEAFSVSGVMAPPPATNIGKHTAMEISVDHRQLISMAVGEVSQILAGPNGYYIYKVASKNIRPLNEVRADVTSMVALQSLEESKEKIDQSIKPHYNTAYFGSDPLSAPASPQTSAGFPLAASPGGRSLAAKGRRVRPSILPQYTLPGTIGSIPGLPDAGTAPAAASDQTP